MLWNNFPDLGKQSHVSAHKGLAFWVLLPSSLTNPFFKFHPQRCWKAVFSSEALIVRATF
jgi:hypothetical protein